MSNNDKKILGVVGTSILLGSCLTFTVMSFVSGCGKPPGPTPDPTIDFEVTGKTIIQGKLKPGAVVSIAEAKRALQTAVDIIDAN